VIRALCYDDNDYVELDIAEFDEIDEIRNRWPVTWINVDGLGDLDVIRRIGESFALHALSLEDIVHVRQRPKFEDFGTYAYIVTQMVALHHRLEYEQVSLFFGDGFVLTFQERPGDCFEPIRDRIRQGRGRIRRMRADYLAYALIDATIDSDFPILEQYGEQVEALEHAALTRREPDMMTRIHGLKMELLSLRRVIWPQRDMVNELIRDGADLFAEQTRVYLRDCYDHTVELLEMLETYREIVSGLVELHLSSISMRINEVMQVLTVIATFFIPLSFIASLYGMNFDRNASPWNMPELGWPLGYPFALGLMAAVACALAWFFWRKGWFSRQEGGEG
jgi:magnesium transporter